MLARIIRLLIVKPIQYLAMKAMVRLRQPDDLRPGIAVAKNILGEIVLPSVFALFEDAQFRQRVRFQQLSDTERDFIFNELHAAGVCLALCCFEMAHAIVKPELFHFWIQVGKQFPKQAQLALIKFGVDDANAKLFRKFINLRFEEYKDLASDAWDMWSEEEPRFRGMPDGMKRVVANIDALAIGAANHILHGNDDVDCRIASCLRDWLYPLNEKIGKFIKNL